MSPAKYNVLLRLPWYIASLNVPTFASLMGFAMYCCESAATATLKSTVTGVASPNVSVAVRVSSTASVGNLTVKTLPSTTAQALFVDHVTVMLLKIDAVGRSNLPLSLISSISKTSAAASIASFSASSRSADLI